MTVKLASPPQTVTFVNERGLIEVVNAHTGEVICVQTTHRDLLKEKLENLVKLEVDGREIYIERGIDPAIFYKINRIPYSDTIASLICEKVVAGEGSVKTIVESFGIPYSIYSFWRKTIPGFRKMVDEAKKDRADAFQDKALETSEKSQDPKLMIDTLKWAAEVDNPEKYGKKTQVTAKVETVSKIIIDTGIRRPGDAGYVEPGNPIKDVVAEEVKVLSDKESPGGL